MVGVSPTVWKILALFPNFRSYTQIDFRKDKSVVKTLPKLVDMIVDGLDKHMHAMVIM